MDFPRDIVLLSGALHVSAYGLAGLGALSLATPASGAWGTNDIVAITMANGIWSVGASATEGGDAIIGSVDLSSVVTATFNRTYNLRSEQTNRLDAIIVTAASLALYDVSAGLRVYFTLV